MNFAVASPVAATTGALEKERSALSELQIFIAALRVKAQVSQATGQSAAAMNDSPMVAVFDPVISKRLTPPHCAVVIV